MQLSFPLVVMPQLRHFGRQICINQHPWNDGHDPHLWWYRSDHRGARQERKSGQRLSGLELTYLSPDGEMGFPGNLAVTVINQCSRNTIFYLIFCHSRLSIF
jgi:hypothetical protein